MLVIVHNWIQDKSSCNLTPSNCLTGNQPLNSTRNEGRKVRRVERRWVVRAGNSNSVVRFKWAYMEKFLSVPFFSWCLWVLPPAFDCLFVTFWWEILMEFMWKLWGSVLSVSLFILNVWFYRLWARPIVQPEFRMQRESSHLSSIFTSIIVKTRRM